MVYMCHIFLIQSIIVECYVLLVVYVTMRFDHSHCYGHCRKNDVEALPKTYKQHVRIQNNSFNEKYGYMEICS